MKLTKILLVVVSQSLKVAKMLVIPQQVQSAADSWQSCSPLAATRVVTLAMQARKQESQHADAKSQHADVSQLVVLLLQ